MVRDTNNSDSETSDTPMQGKKIQSTITLLDSSRSDLSDPYFTHHSDHPGLVLISKVLSGDNYSAWRRAMILALNSKNKLGFVDGKIKAPSEELDPVKYATWSRCNDMVHSWIVNTLNPEIADSIIYYASAHEVWEDLRERFSQSNAPRIFEIQRDIAYLRKEQLSISAYYTRLKGLWDELASYNDVTHGAQQDQQKLMQFLMGLNDSYSAIRGKLLLMNPLPSVRQAYSSISQEEKQRLLSSTDIAAKSYTSAAMAVHSKFGQKPSENPNAENGIQYGNVSQGSRGGINRPNFSSPQQFSGGPHSDFNKRHNGSGRKRPQCTHCGKLGHWVQTCYELHGDPEGHLKSSGNSGPTHFNNNKPIVNHVSEGISKDDGGSVLNIPEAQLKQLLSLLDNKNEGSSSQANLATKPGSGYEEDDWFG